MENMEKAQNSHESQEDLETIAENNFALWNDALATKKPEHVAALYNDEASFLPTLSEKFEHGQGGAVNYFEHFLEKNPNGEVVESTVQTLSPNSYVHSGMYNFEVDDGTGGRTTVEARFTFVWEKNDKGVWQILHHHSSLKPQS